MGVADHRLSVSEAGYVEVQFGEAAKRRGCLGVFEVEDAENHLSFLFRGDVPGDENPLLGKVQRDAAVGMAGSGNDMSAAAEVENVAVADLMVDSNRGRWLLSSRHLSVKFPLEVGEVRRRPWHLRTDGGCIHDVRHDLNGAP